MTNPHLSDAFESGSPSRGKPAVCRAPASEPYAGVSVVPLAELAYEDRGWSRGHAHLGFDDHPPDATGHLDFAPLKLVAPETIDAGRGYPTHPHANIETLLCVLDGALTHEDSLGNRTVAGPSDVALLSAGTGMTHSEMVEGEVPARAILFWVAPRTLGTKPSFLNCSFPRATRTNCLVPVASGRAGAPAEALPLLRDATLFMGYLEAGAGVRHRIAPSRRAYVVAPDAFLTVNCRDVENGERVLVTGPGLVEIHAHAETELFLFDLD